MSSGTRDEATDDRPRDGPTCFATNRRSGKAGSNVARPSAGVQLGAPDRGKDAQSREAPGRRCAEPECHTVLSTYNRSSRCYLHAAPEYRHALER
jgi:hypothetical protein